MAVEGAGVQPMELFKTVQRHIQADPDIDRFYDDLSAYGSNSAAFQGLLVDAFWFLWVQSEGNSLSRQRLAGLIGHCIKDRKVDARVAQEALEHDCLSAAGVLQDVEAWKKKEVRYNTKHNYTINKFNLLREDAEGYAKLLAYLLTGSTASEQDDGPSQASIQQQLQGLIGYFDLDPNRVLDLLLNACAMAPTSHAVTVCARGVELLNAPSVGQLLGNKLASYQVPGSAPAPQALFQLAAGLIQCGAVKLGDLLAHLGPTEDALRVSHEGAAAALKTKIEDFGVTTFESDLKASGASQQQDMARKQANAASLQLSASAVFMDSILAPGAEHVQALGLLEGLLRAEAWSYADQLFKRLQALGVQPAAYDPIASCLCQLLAEKVTPIHEQMAAASLAAASGRSASSTGMLATGQAAMLALPADAWRIITLLGPFLHRDVCLVTKLVRLVRHMMVNAQVAQDTPVLDKLYEVVSTLLLPCLALLPGQVPLSHEVWDILRGLSAETRYRIYTDYRDISSSSPLLVAASRLASLEAKRVLKRLHLPADSRQRKDYCKPHARTITKIAMSNPLPVMETIVQLVEAYDNQLEAVIEALKYQSAFAFDALTYTIISRLAMDRDKVKEDGMNISSWLQSLARLTGSLCRRYADMGVTPICAALASTLRTGDCFELLVLQQLVAHMAGVRIESRLSDEQLDGYAAGPALRFAMPTANATTALYDDGDGRPGSAEKQMLKARRRLLSSLHPDGRRGGNLAVPLLLLTAQQRNIVMSWHREESGRQKPVKFLANLYDKCQETMLGYCEFLRTALSLPEYSSMLPKLRDLGDTYSLDNAQVCHIYRPVLAKLLALSSPAPAPVEDGEVVMEDGEAAGGMEAGETQPEGGVSAIQTGDDEGIPASSEKDDLGPHTWPGLVSDLEALAPNTRLWDIITPHFYAVFWTLSLEDIFVPEERYLTQIAACKRRLQECESNLAMRQRNMYGGREQAPAAQQDALSVMKEDRDRESKSLKDMTAELEQRKAWVAGVEARLKRDKATFFLANKRASGWVPMVQECIMPRAMYSPQDAIFCAKFMLKLHYLEATNLNIPMYFNDVVRKFLPLLRHTTEVEASNMAIFMHETLRVLSHWRSSEAVYQEHCETRSTFLVNHHDITKGYTKYNQYRKLMWIWHRTLTTTFKDCLEPNGEYTSAANALATLNRLVLLYPAVVNEAHMLKTTVEKLQAGDSRDDIKTLARSYLIALEKERNTPGRMLDPHDYGGPGVETLSQKLMQRKQATGGPRRPQPGAGQAPVAGGATSVAASNLAVGGGGAPAQAAPVGGNGAAASPSGRPGSNLRPNAKEFMPKEREPAKDKDKERDAPKARDKDGAGGGSGAAAPDTAAGGSVGKDKDGKGRTTDKAPEKEKERSRPEGGSSKRADREKDEQRGKNGDGGDEDDDRAAKRVRPSGKEDGQGAVAAAQKRQRGDAAGGMLPPGGGSRDPTPQPHVGSGRQAPARQASRGADALPGLEAGVARGHDRQQENNQGQDHGRSRGRDEEGVHDRDKGKSDRAKLDRRETDGRLEEKSGRAADRSDKSDKRDKDRPAKPERERERRDRDDAGKKAPVDGAKRRRTEEPMPSPADAAASPPGRAEGGRRREGH